MDDLEHSVIIAEKDWDTFYEESEECSISPVGLAHLDDSGLSDSDDDKSSKQEPILSLQTQPSKADEEHGAYVQIQNNADDTEDNKCFSSKPDQVKPAEEPGTCFTNGPVTCARMNSEGSINGNYHNLTDQKQNASDTKNLTDNDESHNEDKLSLPPEKLTESLSCIKKAGQTDSPETDRDMMEDSANPKREKERWFVTVNDSPVTLRVKGGTKKRRKKKTSSRLGQPRRIMEEQVPPLKNKDKADGKNIKEGKKEQNEFEQNLSKYSEYKQFRAISKNVYDSLHFQKLELSPVKETGVCFALGFESSDAAGMPADKTKNNISASLSSPCLQFPTQSTHFQSDTEPQLIKKQSSVGVMSNKPKSNLPIISQHYPTHVHDNKRENISKFLPIPSNQTYEEQQYSTQSHNKEKDSSPQETYNKENCDVSLEESVGATHPIYALSSFWDEMEKLTINDIIHLRDANNRSPLRGVSPVYSNYSDLPHSKHNSPQDSSCVDDTTDSDYFTHSDDSKHDRSSGEFSNISDFEEDFLQIVIITANSSPEPQNIKEQTQNSTYIQEFLPEQERELTTSNNESESEDTIISLQDEIPLYLYPDGKATSLHLTSYTNTNENPFDLESIMKVPSPLLSVADIQDNQYLLNFTELFLNDTDEEGLQTRPPYSCSPIPSFAYLSVPETYDDFFSDFAVGNLFFPPVQDKTVPIYTSSHSVVRDLVFPEVEDIVESDSEDDNSPIRVITRFNCHAGRSSSPPGEPNICFSTNQRGNWGRLFSLRRNTVVGKGSIWCQKVRSWIFTKEARQSISYFSGGKAMPCQVHMGMDEVPLLQHITSIKRDGIHFSIKQADMALVCIAFASWVLKSSNSQSTDMWKTALLANVSAISAIQYLRQYVRKKGTEDNL